MQKRRQWLEEVMKSEKRLRLLVTVLVILIGNAYHPYRQLPFRKSSWTYTLNSAC